MFEETSSTHHLQSTIPKVNCAGISLILWRCFSAAGTGGLVRVEENLNAPKYIDSLNEKLIQSIRNLRLDRSFTFQQDNDAKHIAKATQNKNNDLNPIEHLWRDLKMAVHWRSPSNLTELERISKEEWQKIPNPGVQSRLRHTQKDLKAVIAAKDASTKYFYLCKCDISVFSL